MIHLGLTIWTTCVRPFGFSSVSSACRGSGASTGACPKGVWRNSRTRSAAIPRRSAARSTPHLHGAHLRGRTCRTPARRSASRVPRRPFPAGHRNSDPPGAPSCRCRQGSCGGHRSPHIRRGRRRAGSPFPPFLAAALRPWRQLRMCRVGCWMQIGYSLGRRTSKSRYRGAEQCCFPCQWTSRAGGGDAPLRGVAVPSFNSLKMAVTGASSGNNATAKRPKAPTAAESSAGLSLVPIPKQTNKECQEAPPRVPLVSGVMRRRPASTISACAHLDQRVPLLR